MCLFYRVEQGGGVIAYIWAKRRDYYMQMNKGAGYYILLNKEAGSDNLGGSLLATNIWEEKALVTFSAHTINICTQTRGNLYSPSEPHPFGAYSHRAEPLVIDMAAPMSDIYTGLYSVPKIYFNPFLKSKS